MRISLVAAADLEGVIGKDRGLPWHLPADLRRFRRITTGKPVLMGRATWESIGRPLPERTNIVLTTRGIQVADGVRLARSIDEALALAAPCEEAMVIGGATVYAQFLPRADRIYLTTVHARLAGDTRFPALEPGGWRETAREDHGADARNPYPYSFRILDRAARP
jgi:dihydrofolate reductase